MKTVLCLPVLMILVPVIQSGVNKNYPHQRMRRAVPDYKIDVLAVVDWKMFDHWLELSDQQADTAENNIQKYLALVFQGINHRYSNIEDFNISVNLADIKIFKTKDADPVTGIVVIDAVSANKTLHRLANYVQTQGLTNYDHVMLFSGHDIYSTDNGAFFRYTTGQAFVGTMCKGQDGSSVSVVEDRGAFQSVHTASHELAHSLHALHDGTENACSLRARFIMAGGASNVTSGNMFNPWFFSTCSKQEMATFLTQTMQTHGSCLSNQMTKTTNVPNVPYEEMGRLYSPDELCQHIYGTRSYYCRSFGNVSSICHSMYCSAGTVINTCNEHHAPDFTSCGSKEWCVNGQCVFSENASAKDPSCVFGDEPSTRINGKTCSALVDESSAYCYDSVTRDHCCETCKEASTGVTGCEYGDRKTGCSTNLCNAILADGVIMDETCCGICNFRPAEWQCTDSTAIQDLNCAALESHHCYNTTIAFHCCAYCATIRAREKQTKGCEYGDTVPNCDVLTSRGRLCDDGVKSFCCKTCAPDQVNGESRVTISAVITILTVCASILL